MRNLVIFDLDGTLIDSRAVMEAAFREAYAAAVGPSDPPLDAFLSLLGESFPKILEALGLPLTMWEPFREASRARLDQIRVHQGVVATCERLHDQEIALAILTGKDRERTIEILDRLSLLSVFDVVATSSDGFPAKPSPSGVNFICDTLRTIPGHAAMVGDGAFDILAARSAGAWAVGCCWGIATASDLGEAGADQLVDTPAALDQALATWHRRVGHDSRA